MLSCAWKITESNFQCVVVDEDGGFDRVGRGWCFGAIVPATVAVLAFPTLDPTWMLLCCCNGRLPFRRDIVKSWRFGGGYCCEEADVLLLLLLLCSINRNDVLMRHGKDDDRWSNEGHFDHVWRLKKTLSVSTAGNYPVTHVGTSPSSAVYWYSVFLESLL